MNSEGSVVISVELDKAEAEAQLARIKKKIIELETELNAQQNNKTALEEKMKNAAAAVDAAKTELEAYKAELARLNEYQPGDREYLFAQSKIPIITQQIKEQEAAVAGVERQYRRAASAVDAQNAKIDDTTAHIEAQKVAYGEIQQQALMFGEAGEEAGEQTADGMTSAADATSALVKRLDKTITRIVSLAKRVFFFSLITRALRSFREFFGKSLKANDEFAAALARLKGALLTAFMPIYTYVVPALTTLINFLAKAVQAIASFISSLFGTTVEESADAAENLYDEADALDDVGGAAGKAAKKLASFDEINKLGGDDGGGGGGIGKKIKPDFGLDGEGLGKELNDKLAGLLVLAGEALIAVGFIVAFTGNIPLGIGLIAAGAVAIGTAKTLNPEGVKKALDGPIGKIIALAGIGLVAVGFIVAFTGNILLGIGLIAAGAAVLGTEKKLNPNALKSAISGPIAKILLITGELLVTVGFIVAFTGNIALGIGLIAAGAVALGTAKGLNPEGMAAALNGPIATVLVVGGMLLLVVGFIVAFTGHIALGIGLIAAGAAVLGSGAFINKEALAEAINGPIANVIVVTSMLLIVAGFIVAFTGHIPLGIGLIAAGAAVLGAAAFLNADALRKALEGPIGMAVVVTSELLLLVGIIVALTGNLPLGFGLIIAGAGILGTAIAINKNAILEHFQEQWDAIKRWWDRDVAPVFTAQWWTNKLNAIAEGAKAAMNSAITAIETALNWIIDKANTLSINIGTPWGEQHIGINIPRITIPRLAQGAVIPPNKEFLAVLGDQKQGTNIEAPLETMVAAFKQALGEGAGSRTVVLQIGEYEFGRLVLDAFNTEDSRVGISMVR